MTKFKRYVKNVEELWKDIEGFEGLYQVSNLGKVRSLWFGKEKIMKPRLAGRGYPCLTFYKKGKKKAFYVHRLVAETFIKNINDEPQVNHKDGDKENNCISNLEWSDNSKNNQHAYDNLAREGYWKGKSSYKHHSSKPVIGVKPSGVSYIFGSSAEADRQLKVCDGRVRNSIRLNREFAGMKWSYL